MHRFVKTGACAVATCGIHIGISVLLIYAVFEESAVSAIAYSMIWVGYNWVLRFLMKQESSSVGNKIGEIYASVGGTALFVEILTLLYALWKYGGYWYVVLTATSPKGIE